VLVQVPETQAAPSPPPPAAEREVCEIRGRRDVGALRLYTPDDPARSAAVALVSRDFELTWSDFRRGAARAHVRFSRPKVAEFDGLAQLGEDWFQTTRPFELVPGCVSTWKGADVHPEEAHGRMLVVSARTPFAVPERVETTVDCTALSFTPVDEEKPPQPETIARMLLVSDTLDLHPTPGEPRALRAAFTDPAAVHSVVERAPGWLRVFEPGPSSNALCWVPEAQLKPPPRFGRSHRTRAPRVHRDYVLITSDIYEVLNDAPLFAGDAASRTEIAKILKGARIRIVTRDGNWLEIAYERSELVRGELGSFWVSADVVTREPVDVAPP